MSTQKKPFADALELFKLLFYNRRLRNVTQHATFMNMIILPM